MIAEIKGLYTVDRVSEISVDWNGSNYLVIYGRHINGWFIAISNWEVCVEASEPKDVFYNAEKLAKVLDDANAGKELAETIKTHWEINNYMERKIRNEEYEMSDNTAALEMER